MTLPCRWSTGSGYKSNSSALEGSVRVSHGAFADDIALYAVTPAGLQVLADDLNHQLGRVIATPAVYPRLVEFLHFDIQSTGQKSHCVNTVSGHRNALF